MSDIKILIVEDEPAVRDMIGLTLEQAGYQWVYAENVAQARSQLQDHNPDLVLLDWMLPDISGLDFARQLRQDETTKDLPIILLTARDAENDKIRGLEVGTDDYITKPFSPRELIARIKAVLRRTGHGQEETVITLGHLKMDGVAHRVAVDDHNIKLGPTEFRLLQFLMTHPDRVFNRDQLLDRVWGRNVYIDDRTVDVHIRRLRKALSPYGCDHMIQTVRGAGYRLSLQE